MADRDLIAEIVEQRQRVLDLRERHERQMEAETRRLAELVDETRDHPDPHVNPTAAAKAMGVTKNYAHQLIRSLRDETAAH